MTDFITVQVNSITKDQNGYHIIHDPNGFVAKITPPKGNPPRNIMYQSSSTSLPNQLLGIAIDGVPIYSALASVNGADMISSNTIGRIDQCGGILGDTIDGPRYHYRVMPTCLHGFKVQQVNLMRNIYVDDVYELLKTFDSLALRNFSTYIYTRYLLGYALDGFPIYSPYDSNGLLQGIALLSDVYFF
jgi:hypothetical protein